MAYEFTFTPRFQKHFKGLTVQEKKQLKNKLELLAENPSHPSLRTKRICKCSSCGGKIIPLPTEQYFIKPKPHMLC